ncbi:hypothetical protein [Streptomyces sp. P9-A2]|uniref:hypothetical protein n=1 Tax=Streptomyces sp. P9-A2 TaxID=3072284 RepID=UPI003FCDB247
MGKAHLDEPRPGQPAFQGPTELTTRRKAGTAELVTRALLENRHEDLVVLLVDTEHPRVQAMCESWGFRKVGDRRPFPDSPLYAVMPTELPLKS